MRGTKNMGSRDNDKRTEEGNTMYGVEWRGVKHQECVTILGSWWSPVIYYFIYCMEEKCIGFPNVDNFNVLL